MEKITQTVTITATKEVWLRLTRFFALMHYNGGHSATFGMSFDGDGADSFKIDPEPSPELRLPAQRIGDAGPELELACDNRYSSQSIDHNRPRYEYYNNKLVMTHPTEKIVREYK